MLSSIFCLQPAGDSPTRKGFFESILLGCIPVIFRRGTYSTVWSGTGVDWDDIALVVEEEHLLETEGDIVAILRNVPAAEVRRRQRDVADVAARVQYSMPSEGEGAGFVEDAFGMLLRRLQGIKSRV